MSTIYVTNYILFVSSNKDSVPETCNEKIVEIEAPITVGIKVKEPTLEIKDEEPNDAIEKEIKEENQDNEQPRFGSEKEKQCWEMYCKMVNKGLKVSYDTILRGMLTPTEYRLRRKESIVGGVSDDGITLQ